MQNAYVTFRDSHNLATNDSSAEDLWPLQPQDIDIQQRQAQEAKALGVAGMTLGEVDKLFERGPDAAVEFLVTEQLSGFGTQMATVGVGTVFGLVVSVLAVYVLPPA